MGELVQISAILLFDGAPVFGEVAVFGQFRAPPDLYLLPGRYGAQAGIVDIFDIWSGPAPLIAPSRTARTIILACAADRKLAVFWIVPRIELELALSEIPT
jgi:hypothetical protein